MLNPDDIFLVYRLRHAPDGEMQRQLAGRFCFLNGEVAVLEDYFGLLKGLDGPIDEEKQNFIRSLHNSAYIDVVRAGDARDGSRPDLLPLDTPDEVGVPSGDASPSGIAGASVAATPPSVWDYQRPGMEKPQVLEWHQPTNTGLLNGQALSEEEMQQLLHNLDTGTAVLRYRGTAALPGVAKMETELDRLFKAEDDPGDKDLFGVMEHLRNMAGGGQIPAEHLDTLHDALYGDPMVTETRNGQRRSAIGNKRAYKDFLSRPREGVHVMMDANDFKSINDDLGHDVGDKAITQMGTAMRQAMDETVGREHGKVFRFGGDEFAAHLPSHEHAAQFARALRSKLETVPPLGGTHKLSISMGLGNSPETADQALNVHAKGAKQAAVQALTGMAGSRQKVRAPATMYAHSLFPGHEGQIPTHVEKPPNVAATLQRPHEEAPHVATAPTGAGPAGLRA